MSEVDTARRSNTTSSSTPRHVEGEEGSVILSKGSPLYDREDHRVVNRQGSHVGSGVSRRLNDHILHHEESKREAVPEVAIRGQRAPKTEGGLFIARNEYSFETKMDECPEETGIVRPIRDDNPQQYTRYLADSDDDSGTIGIFVYLFSHEE